MNQIYIWGGNITKSSIIVKKKFQLKLMLIILVFLSFTSRELREYFKMLASVKNHFLWCIEKLSVSTTGNKPLPGNYM